MLKLCRRDAAAGFRYWLLVLLMYAVYSPFFSRPVFAFILTGLFLFVGLILVPLILEDRFHTEILFSSLPVKRAEVVGARYLLGFILLAFASLFFTGYAFVQKEIGWLRALAAVRPFRPEWLIAYTATGILFMSFFLPLYFRLGLGRAYFVFSGALLGMVIASGILLQLGYSLSTGRSLFASRFFLSPLKWLSASGKRMIQAMDWHFSLLLLLTILALVAYASFRLAVHFYHARDL